MAKAKRKMAVKKPAKAQARKLPKKAPAAPSVQKQLEASVKTLMGLEDSEIEIIIGQQLAKTKEELGLRPVLSAAGAVTMVEDGSKLMAAPDWIKDLGRRFMVRFNAQMYSLFCNKEDPDYETIVKAAAQGAEKLAFILSGVMVATFGWLPGIAAAVAVIIAKRAVKVAHEEFCRKWKESL